MNPILSLTRRMGIRSPHPVVATLLAAIAAIVSPTAIAAKRYDIDGDGRSDILWRINGQFASWLMRGSSLASYFTMPEPAGYYALSEGDFDADNRADLLWMGPSRDLWIWYGRGTMFAAEKIGDAPAGWTVRGVGDVTGDGRSDLIWRHDASGAVAYWEMNGANAVDGALVAPSIPSGYRLLGVEDMNADGREDAVWVDNFGNRDIWVWTAFANASTGKADFSAAYAGAAPDGWGLLGVNDIDGDGSGDLYWRNATTGAFAYWRMNGATVVDGEVAGPLWPYNQNYLLASGDYNGDGRADFLWVRNSRELWMWANTGSGFSQQFVADYPAGWTLIR